MWNRSSRCWPRTRGGRCPRSLTGTKATTRSSSSSPRPSRDGGTTATASFRRGLTHNPRSPSTSKTHTPTSAASRTSPASPRPAPYRTSDSPERFRGSHSLPSGKHISRWQEHALHNRQARAAHGLDGSIPSPLVSKKTLGAAVDSGSVGCYLCQRAAADDGLRSLGDYVRAGSRGVVAPLDQEPLGLGPLSRAL